MNVFFKLQFEKLHNFQLFTFNFQLFPGGGQRADVVIGPYGRGTADG
jgi:hypothetical protein